MAACVFADVRLVLCLEGRKCLLHRLDGGLVDLRERVEDRRHDLVDREIPNEAGFPDDFDRLVLGNDFGELGFLLWVELVNVDHNAWVSFWEADEGTKTLRADAGLGKEGK